MNKQRKVTVQSIYDFLSSSLIGQKVVEVLKAILLFRNFYFDFRRFLKWSFANNKISTETNLRALITMDYHRLEKGLALTQPKVGFGRDVIERLSHYLPDYQDKYGTDETVMIVLNDLQEYYDFNLEFALNHELAHQTITRIKDDASQYDQSLSKKGGTKTVTRTAIQGAAKIDLRNFFQSRYSVRQFTEQEVDISLIEQAVEMAQKTPSVCNRQSCKVYVFSEEEQKKKILSYQNGNRGFGDRASKVLIVASNLEHFASVGERYQGWIDGGMFAMSLVYALHSLGLGTCCLNWCVKHAQDRNLKESAGIAESDLVIMMIVVGHLPEEFKVAQSPRKPIHEVLIFPDSQNYMLSCSKTKS